MVGALAHHAHTHPTVLRPFGAAQAQHRAIKCRQELLEHRRRNMAVATDGCCKVLPAAEGLVLKQLPFGCGALAWFECGFELQRGGGLGKSGIGGHELGAQGFALCPAFGLFGAGVDEGGRQLAAGCFTQGLIFLHLPGAGRGPGRVARCEWVGVAKAHLVGMEQLPEVIGLPRLAQLGVQLGGCGSVDGGPGYVTQGVQAAVGGTGFGKHAVIEQLADQRGFLGCVRWVHVSACEDVGVVVWSEQAQRPIPRLRCAPRAVTRWAAWRMSTKSSAALELSSA